MVAVVKASKNSDVASIAVIDLYLKHSCAYVMYISKINTLDQMRVWCLILT
jgi:hypothetical protein